MKLRTQGFKDNIKKMGRELDVKVTHDNEVLDSEVVNTFKPHFNTEFFKTIMKTFDFDSNIKVPAKTWVTPEFGVKVGSEYEYLNYGRYYINEEPEYSADNRAYTHKCYDAMIESMTPYDDNPLYIEYPISYDDLIIAICNQLGWTYDLPADYPNKDTMIEYDLYSNLGLTYRDILDDLCPATMGNFIVSDNKELKIIYPTETGDIIDEEYLKDANVNVCKKVGPINSLVLSRAEEGDTINRIDEENINDNGLNEIKIKDNLLLSAAFRENFIDEMFEKIKGFEYYSIDVASTGVAYYEPLDRFTMSIEGENYSVVLLNSELNIEGGVSENLFTPELEESVTDYSTSALSDKGKKMANIIAYKNEARIKMTTEETKENSSKISEMEQTVDGFKSTISKVDDIEERTTIIEENIDGLNIGLSSIGGTNLIKNSVGHYQGDWDNLHAGFTNTEIKNNTVSKHCFFVGNKTSKQVIQVQNGTYTIGYKYKKLLELAEVKIKVNDHEIELTEMDWTTGNYTFEVLSNAITVELIGDNDNSCYLSDLMINQGIVAHVWSSASGESINGGVKIGSSIEIESSVSNIKQIMDNDGNRIKNMSTDETVAEFTDKGMNSKEIKTEKAEIARIVIQNVGNQTWISRI